MGTRPIHPEPSAHRISDGALARIRDLASPEPHVNAAVEELVRGDDGLEEPQSVHGQALLQTDQHTKQATTGFTALHGLAQDGAECALCLTCAHGVTRCR